MDDLNLSKGYLLPKYCEFGVIFTRSAIVSQYGENEALERQKRICEEHAKRMNVKILQYFGGIRGTSKNNVRSEIIRMHYFLEKYDFIGKVLLTRPDKLKGRLRENIDLQERLLTLNIDLTYCLPFDEWK